MSDEVSWDSKILNKGKFMSRQIGGDIIVSVEHPDRRIDPYLAGVIDNNIIVYTGLHPTLSSAKRKCLEVANIRIKRR